jgi:hypothetical protein
MVGANGGSICGSAEMEPDRYDPRLRQLEDE